MWFHHFGLHRKVSHSIRKESFFHVVKTGHEILGFLLTKECLTAKWPLIFLGEEKKSYLIHQPALSWSLWGDIQVDQNANFALKPTLLFQAEMNKLIAGILRGICFWTLNIELCPDERYFIKISSQRSEFWFLSITYGSGTIIARYLAFFCASNLAGRPRNIRHSVLEVPFWMFEYLRIETKLMHLSVSI